MFTIHARELQPNADVAACGAPLPFTGTDDGRDRTFHFFHLGPAFGPAEDSLGVFELSCVRGTSTAWPPTFIARDVTARLKKHSRGEVVTDEDAVARRVLAAHALLKMLPKVPTRGLADDTDARAPAIEAISRMLLERYALPTDIVVQLMATIGVSEPEATNAARRMSEQKDAVWPWNDAGAALDAKARDEEMARLRAEVEAEQRAAIDAQPNTKTCRELVPPVFVTRRREKSPPVPLAPSGNGDFTRDGFVYFVFDASDLLGLTIPEGEFFETNGSVLAPDFVIPLSNREVRELRPRSATIDPRMPLNAPGLAALEWRKGKIDSSPVDATRTLRDADCQWLVQEIAHLFAPFAARIIEQSVKLRTITVTPDHKILAEPIVTGASFNPLSRLWKMLVAFYARNGIRKDVAWSAMLTLLRPAYEEATSQPVRVISEERIVWVDNRGREYADDPSKGSWKDEYGQPLTYTAKTYPQVLSERPPFPLTEEVFAREFDNAARGGPSCVVGKDELLARKPTTSKELTMLEKVVAMFKPDPWRKVIANVVRTNTAPGITTAVIESELRAAKLVEHIDHEGHVRIASIMRRLGKKKGQRTIDGRRQQCWVDDDGKGDE